MTQFQPVDIANPKSNTNLDKMDELFTRLRKEDPVTWVEPEGFLPFWAITKFADIKEMQSKLDTFKGGPIALLYPKAAEDEFTRIYGTPQGARTILNMDNPDHKTYRSLQQSWFSPDKMQKFKDTVRANAKDLINKLAAFNGQCDFATNIGRVFPLRNIMMLFGIPAKDEDLFLKLSDQILHPAEYISTENITELVKFAAQKSEEMIEYFRGQIKDRRANPQDDLLTTIANAKIEGELMPEFELTSMLIYFGTAGHVTSGVTISESIYVFAKKPDILKQLQNNLSLIPNATEEIIRWAAPVYYSVRTAVKDYEIRDHKIKAGQRLVFCYRSGCRDEEYIDDPFTFRLDRTQNRHIAFGIGPHTCLGQQFTRLETAIFFEELIPRLVALEMDGEIIRSEALTFAGTKSLPIKYVIK